MPRPLTRPRAHTVGEAPYQANQLGLRNTLQPTTVPWQARAVSADSAAKDAAIPAVRAATPESEWDWTRGSELGHGAFGKVFLGINNKTGGFMAVKEVRRDDAMASTIPECGSCQLMPLELACNLECGSQLCQPAASA